MNPRVHILDSVMKHAHQPRARELARGLACGRIAVLAMAVFITGVVGAASEPETEGIDLAPAASLESGEVTVVEYGDGVALLAVGEAEVSTQAAFPERERPRAAVLAASVIAKDAMGTYLNGRLIESETRVIERIESESREAGESITTTLTSEERHRSVLEAVLEGVVLADVKHEGDVVRVTIVSTPSSRAFKAGSPRVIMADTVAAGVHQVQQGVLAGGLPPMGCRLLKGRDGKTAWIAWGGAVPQSTSYAHRRVAKTVAGMRAKRGWLFAASGEDVSSEDEFTRKFRRIERMGTASDDRPAIDVEWKDAMNSVVNTASEGQVPPGAKQLGLDGSLRSDLDGAFFVFLVIDVLDPSSGKEST